MSEFRKRLPSQPFFVYDAGIQSSSGLFFTFYSIMTKKLLINFIACYFILTNIIHAVTIVPTYIDGAGQTWTAERRGVIQQAINDWQAALPDSHTVAVTFDLAHAGTGSYLGQWEGYLSLYPGTDVYPWTSGVEHTIHFNVDYFSGTNYLWWDPTPTTSSDQPFAAWDALSVARHEIGHMMGFTDDFYVNNFYQSNEYDKWGIHISGSTFDPGGLNVSMTSASDWGHVLDGGSTANDLMVAALYNGQRHGISATDLNMLHLAYNYTVVPPITGTTYTLTASAGKTTMHVGASCSVTATVANTGTGTADTLDFAGLRASASGGTIGGSSTSGGPLANAGGSASNSGLTFTASTAGTYTITPSVTSATNHSLGTAATLSTVTPASVTVYSGQGVWNGTGPGSWLDTSKWTTAGGVPGIDGTLSANDTATLSKTLSTAATISLNGATPRLASLTFNTPNKSFNIATGTGGSLTMKAANEASISVLQNSATISAPLILGSNTTIGGPGVLNSTGGITGNYTLTVTGKLNAASINVDTLRIGTSFAATVPEPSSLILLGFGAFCSILFASRYWKSR
jgi:hypothetical protein